MRKNSQFLYKNIFLYASLQFCGNIEEYFSETTEKLIVFIVMPRTNNTHNLIRVYEKGLLLKEEKLRSSSNVFLYYAIWYVQYLIALARYFNKRDDIYVISFHPITFLGMTIQKTFRKITYIYWIGDYFPPINSSLKLYELVKKYYHNKIPFTCYLSDRINEKMNGKVTNNTYRKTVMWGVNPKKIQRNKPNNNFNLLFVGLIKESQGLENIFTFLETQKKFCLKIIGVCDNVLYQRYIKIIEEKKITNRVYFPNKFIDDSKLVDISKDCHVGIALYDMNRNNATNFADPGKVKSYAEMKLPVVMSDISDIVKYVKKFKSGEVVRTSKELPSAFSDIQNNYSSYQKGLDKFNRFFYYKDYYKKAFSFMNTL